jgi:hypothetical protein
MTKIKNKDTILIKSIDDVEKSGIDNLDYVIHKFEQSDPDAVRFSFTITDESEDRDGDIILRDGAINLDKFDSTGVMLWNHDPSLLPIGKPVVTYNYTDSLNGKRSISSIAQMTNDLQNDFGAMVSRLYAGGFLKAVSIGATVNDYERRNNGGMLIKSWELLEFSAVNIGSNRNALIDAQKSGVNLKPLIEYYEQRESDKLFKEQLVELHKALNTKTVVAVNSIVDEAKVKRLAMAEALNMITRSKVDWAGVALALKKPVGQTLFNLAIKANTFADVEPVEFMTSVEKNSEEALASLNYCESECSQSCEHKEEQQAEAENTQHTQAEQEPTPIAEELTEVVEVSCEDKMKKLIANAVKKWSI